MKANTECAAARTRGWRWAGLALLSASVASAMAGEAIRANENAALRALHALRVAQVDYFLGSLPSTYAGSLACLASGNGAGGVRFLSPEMGSGRLRGYEFELRPGPEADGIRCRWSVVARPESYGRTGVRSFLLDENGDIRAADIGGDWGTDDMPVIESGSGPVEVRVGPNEVSALATLRAMASESPDESAGKRLKDGYYFDWAWGGPREDLPFSWSAAAWPVGYGCSGVRSFHIDESGVARGQDLQGRRGDRSMPSLSQSALSDSQPGVARVLMEAGADANARDEAGLTALHVAAGSGDLEMVRELLARGADVHAVYSGNVPLHETALAATGLIGPWDANASKIEYGTPFGERIAPVGPAREAAAIRVARLLVESRARIDATEYGRPPGQGETVLHMAAAAGARHLAEALLDRGADPNANSDSVGTPLHVSAAGGRLDLVELLLARGADPNIRFTASGAGPHLSPGATPLHQAVSCGWAPIVGRLIQAGADPEALDGQGRTALALASESSEMLVRGIYWDWPEEMWRPVVTEIDGRRAEVAKLLAATAKTARPRE